MFASFDFDVIGRSLGYLFFDGMTFTLTLTGLAALGGLIFGTLLALMRLSGLKLLGWIAGLYVDLMRSLPLVLVIFWFYFLVPYIGQWLTGSSRPIRVGAFTSSLVTFIMFEAAYFSEIMRAGIQSISKGQPAAAQALGLTYSQTMRYVVLPQAFRNMLPVLLTQTIVLFQDTSLVYVLSIPDFLGAASKVAQRDGRLVEMYLFAAAVYFAISCVASFGVRRLQARIAYVHQRELHDRNQPCRQMVRSLSGAEGLHHQRRQGRGGGGVWSVRLGEIDPDQMRQRTGAVPERADHPRRHQGQRPQDRPAKTARPRRHGVPAF